MDQPRDPSRPWAPSPFGRLARAHALSVCGDAMFTTAMAGLVFFSVSRLDQARWQVAAALLFTIVPFSLAAPFIGPLIDRARGGRQWMIVALCVLRGLVCLTLAFNRDNQYLMYPQFTLVLVFAQGYILARGALVPATVHSDTELVRANSKLAAISGVAAVAGGAAALLVMWVLSLLDIDGGPGVALSLAAVVYAVAAVEAGRLPAVRVAAAPPDAAETEELTAPGIQAAAAALSVVRVVVGFTTFLLAFHFKNLEEVDAWGSRVGLVGCVVVAQAGFLLGSAVAIRVRRAIVEEQIILAALALIGVVGLLTSVMGELAGALMLAGAVGLGSNSAKQSFDAVVQRDAPDANRGRAFARFETRFQLCWVAGALVPVAVTVAPARGALAVGLLGAAGAVWFAAARGRAGVGVARRRRSSGAGEPTLVEPRPISRAFLRRLRPVTAAPAAVTGFVAPVPPFAADGEATVEQLPVDEPVDAVDVADAADGDDEATIEMADLADLHAATRPLPLIPTDDDGEPTLVAGVIASDGDRTAVWPGPPPAPPAPPAPGADRWFGEPPWRGALGPDAAPAPVADGGGGPAPIAGRRGPARRPPLTDDELGAPSDVAWLHRPADEPAAGAEPDDTGLASEAWGPVARRPPRPRLPGDDHPGDPDDRR
jgi:hypothetical protein